MLRTTMNETTVMLPRGKTNFENGFIIYVYKNDRLINIIYEPKMLYEDSIENFLQAIEGDPMYLKQLTIHWPEDPDPDAYDDEDDEEITQPSDYPIGVQYDRLYRSNKSKEDKYHGK